MQRVKGLIESTSQTSQNQDAKLIKSMNTLYLEKVKEQLTGDDSFSAASSSARHLPKSVEY